MAMVVLGSKIRSSELALLAYQGEQFPARKFPVIANQEHKAALLCLAALLLEALLWGPTAASYH